MPPLARWYIKIAMLSLVAALLAGVVVAAGGLRQVPPVVAALWPTYVHLLVVGWITEMIFGVAYWMFPKASPERPRGNDALAIATFVALNAGLGLRVIAEPWNAVHPAPALGALLVAAAGLQWLAGLGFVAATWPRVR